MQISAAFLHSSFCILPFPSALESFPCIASRHVWLMRAANLHASILLVCCFTSHETSAANVGTDMETAEEQKKPGWLRIILIGRSPGRTLLRIIVLILIVFVARAYV